MSVPYGYDPAQYREPLQLPQPSLPSQHTTHPLDSSDNKPFEQDPQLSLQHVQSGDRLSNDDNQTKTFSCSSCKKAFARRSDLVRHERIHSGDRPHVCSHEGCGKQFIQRSALTVHQRVHTREKPHLCEKCGKPFSDSSSLARHRRIHSGMRPYKCPYADCQKTFTRRTTLTRHISHHTGTVEEAAEARATALATHAHAQMVDDSKMARSGTEDQSDASSSTVSHARSSSTRAGPSRAVSAQMQRHPPEMRSNGETDIRDNMDPALSAMPSRSQSAMANRQTMSPGEQDFASQSLGAAPNGQMQQPIPNAHMTHPVPHQQMQPQMMNNHNYTYQDPTYPPYGYYQAPDIKHGVWADGMS